MTFEGSGPSPPRGPGQREGAAAERQVLSVPVAGSVAETPRLIEGTELGLEYAPFDEDDGPVDCDCPASCYRGHRVLALGVLSGISLPIGIHSLGVGEVGEILAGWRAGE